MDWCNTKVDGKELDPKDQYPQMVNTSYLLACSYDYGFVSSPKLSIPLGNLSSSTRVSGVWRTHGRGWDSMPTHGGVDLTIMMSGSQQLTSLSTTQTRANMQVCYNRSLWVHNDSGYNSFILHPPSLSLSPSPSLSLSPSNLLFHSHNIKFYAYMYTCTPILLHAHTHRSWWME